MSEESRQLPTVWWRRAAAAIDGLDVAAAVSCAALCGGLFLLWGLGVMLTVAGGLGLTAVAASAVAGARAERQTERR